jgi:cell division topological specificity factor
MENILKWFKRNHSKDVAKERLKLVLIHDRSACSSCSTEVLEMMRNDIIQVITKYMEIDRSKLDIQISKTSSGNTLSANFPIVSIRKVNEKK